MDPNRPWSEQTPEPLFAAGSPRAFSRASWSPDGKSIVGHMDGSGQGIVIVDIESKQIREITKSGDQPVFLHDGRRLIFTEDDSKLMLVDLEGHPPQVLLDLAPDGLFNSGTSVSSDDSLIYYTRLKTESDVWLLQIE